MVLQPAHCGSWKSLRTCSTVLSHESLNHPRINSQSIRNLPEATFTAPWNLSPAFSNSLPCFFSYNCERQTGMLIVSLPTLSKAILRFFVSNCLWISTKSSTYFFLKSSKTFTSENKKLTEEVILQTNSAFKLHLN